MHPNFAHLFFMNIRQEVLLVRRINTPYCNGCYALPGGKILPGETARQALVREAENLLGLELNIDDLSCVHVMHRKCNKPEFFAYIFTVNADGLVPFNNKPELHDEIGWYPINSLPEPMVPAHEHALKMIREKQTYSEHGWLKEDIMFHIVVDNDIQLVLLQPEHAQELYALVDVNRSYLRTFLPWVDSNTDISHTHAAIERGRQRYASHQELFCGIILRGEIVGTIHLKEVDQQVSKATIGYWLAESYQGRGIVTKSIAAIMRYAFDTLHLNRIEICCAADNLKSCAIPERLGFTRKGVLHHAGKLVDRTVNLIVYELLSSEWKCQNHA